MATKFVPLRMEGVEEGRFQTAINEALADIQREHILHVRKYGKELAKKSKSKLKVELSLVFEGRDENDFSVKGTIRKEVPARPPAVTTAMAGDEQDDEPTLFVRKSGSTEDHPKQGIITTKEGHLVDPETGEVKKD